MNPPSLRRDAWAHLRRRRTLAWAGILVAVGAALCFVPLFDLLGYEFSAAIAMIASLASAHLGAVHQRAAADTRLVRAFAAACVAHLLLLLPPLLLISLNAVRVRNCDYLEGLAFFGLLPGLSVPCATLAGVCAAALVRRPALATASALAVVLGSWLVGLLRFYLEPPVHAFDPFLGYLPGALYDEDVAITPALLWSRLMNVVLLAAVLLISAQRPIRALVALAAGAALHVEGPRLGFRNDAGDVAAALGGRHETPHFVLHYRDDGRTRDLEAMARDHEFRYAQLARAFGTRPRGRVHSYLFGSAAEKRRLLGAGQTFVAKPWRREMYLQEGEPPQPALRHELAHVFAAEWAGGPLGIPPTFDLGLVEGLAVALDWPADEGLDPHAQARVLRDSRLLPPIASVLGRGFLGHAPARAYVIAGSFIGDLLDRHGPGPLRRAYASGDLAAAYGRPLAALEIDWHDTLARTVVDAAGRAALEERFRRPAIWRRVCAHEIATLSREADRLQAARPEDAVDLLRRIAELDPGEPSHRLALGDGLARAHRPQRARRVFEEVLAHPAASAALRQRAHGAVGDLAWSNGRLDEAALAFDRAAGSPAAGEGERRLLALKRAALLADPAARDALREFLLAPPAGRRDAFVDGVLLARLAALMPGDGIPGYLLGRQLVQRTRYREAVVELRPACAAVLPSPDFVRECHRMLATAAWRSGDAETARASLRALLAARDAGGDAAFAKDLGERLDWERSHRERAP